MNLIVMENWYEIIHKTRGWSEYLYFGLSPLPVVVEMKV